MEFKNRQAVIKRERILIPQFNRKYYHVNLMKNNIPTITTVHRLVAKAFIPNPGNKPQVNHIDGNKLNNIVDNLEWCTARENAKHAYRNGLEKIYKGVKNYHYGKKSHKRKKVYQYTLDNKLIRIWDCAGEVNKKMRISTGNIASCCRGQRKTTGGYKWRYELRKEE